MDRRDFLTRLGLLSAAAVLMDPAELIERLAPRRLLVPGADFAPAELSPFGARVTATTTADLTRLMKEIYGAEVLRPLAADGDYIFAANGYTFDRRGALRRDRSPMRLRV